MIRPGQDAPFAQVIPLNARPKAETQVILARHHGRCAGCRGAIRIEEEIVRIEGSWYHVECRPVDTVGFIDPWWASGGVG